MPHHLWRVLCPPGAPHGHREPAPRLLLVVEGAHAVLPGGAGVDVEDGEVVRGAAFVQPVAGGGGQSGRAVEPTNVWKGF